MSPFVLLLLQLLVSFLSALFEKWLKSYDVLPSAEVVAGKKEAFLKSVKWKFWLGTSRMARADKAFDLAVENYKASGQKMSLGAKQLASSIVDPLGLLIK